jgi:hypothetical protein
VKAHYAGDGNFAASDDPTGVAVTVMKESSRLQYGIVTMGATGNILSTNATSFAYGSPYILRIDILNSTNTACQPLVTGGVTTGCAVDATGTVTITDSVNGAAPVPLDIGTFAINSFGHAEDQPIQLLPGTHNLSATYPGDISYNSAGPVADSLTVSKATTTAGVVASPSTLTLGTSTMVSLTATINTQSNGAAPTGTVQFLNGSTPITGTVTLTGVAGSASSTGFASLTATLTTSLSALAIPQRPMPRGPILPLLPVMILLCVSIFLAYATFRLSKNRRRGYVYASLILIVSATCAIAGCSGGSSGPKIKTITINANYSGDGNYSSSTGQTTLTAQ